MYQNLTRAYAPALDGNLFHWLTTLYPKWSLLDEEGAYISAWVGLAELAESDAPRRRIICMSIPMAGVIC